MVVQFICRGNALRSIVAEAYLKSLTLPDVIVCSSGSVASKYKESNAVNFSKTLALLRRHGIERYAKDHYADNVDQQLLDKSDILIFLNAIAYQEVSESFKIPENAQVWDVTDLGEEGRVANTEAEREAYSEEIYEEIVKNIDELVRSNRLQLNK